MILPGFAKRLLRLDPLPLAARCRRLIEQYARRKSFADVGCMWGVHGEYAFWALESGAQRVVGLDMMPATRKFTTRNESQGRRVEFVNGDINSRTVTDAIGSVDVVFCSGVLYHMPNPLFTIGQLRRICGEVLILCSATIGEQRFRQSAVFLPLLDEQARTGLRFGPSDTKIGIDSDFARDEGYANWFWGFSTSCLEAMLKTEGFRVTERYQYRRAACFVCQPDR